MAKFYQPIEVQKIEVPIRYFNFAVRRTKSILTSWLAADGDKLSNLVASVYLQGVEDGFRAAQSQKAGGENHG